MRNRALHDALRDFALEAAARLVRATEAGAEIEFALDERHEGSATLYRYRPLTAEYIAARWGDLRALPSFEPAARTLGTGARAYLRRRGEPGADAEPALRTMLQRLYEDSTSFAFPEERFERVYAGVERALYAGTVHAAIVAPVLGLRLEGARLELGGDLSLVDVALLAPPPAPAWLDREEEEVDVRGRVTAYLLLERDLPSDAPLPLAEARGRFRSALLALRLLERGGVALGPLGYSRVGEARWQPLRLEPSGWGRGADRPLAGEDADELRELLHGIESGAERGPVAWALGRFEMGLERRDEVEALSDYLLALRALLDPARAAEPATLALRLAALCAEEGDRRAVQRRIEAVCALEPFVIEGGLAAARGERYLEAVGRHGPQVLVRELEDVLRHLLAGVLREELDTDLAGLADEVLLRTGEPIEVRARRLGGVDAEASDAVRAPGAADNDDAAHASQGAGGDRAAEEAARGDDPEPSEPSLAPSPRRSRKRPALALVDAPSAGTAAPADAADGPDAARTARLPQRGTETDWDPDDDESYWAPV